jgi:hypothetical protein
MVEPAVREGALADVEACRERVSHTCLLVLVGV